VVASPVSSKDTLNRYISYFIVDTIISDEYSTDVSDPLVVIGRQREQEQER
jgi:hypothetical protein